MLRSAHAAGHRVGFDQIEIILRLPESWCVGVAMLPSRSSRTVSACAAASPRRLAFLRSASACMWLAIARWVAFILNFLIVVLNLTGLDYCRRICIHGSQVFWV